MKKPKGYLSLWTVSYTDGGITHSIRFHEKKRADSYVKFLRKKDKGKYARKADAGSVILTEIRVIKEEIGL